MKRALAILVVAVLLSGCAETLAILDVLADKPKPVPVCNEKTLGVMHDGKWCLLFNDGQYRWVEQRYKEKK